MRHRDGDTAGFFFRRIIDGVETAELHLGIILCQHLGNSRRQRGLAMIDMPDRADVDVRLAAIKFFLCHECLLVVSATSLRNFSLDPVYDLLGYSSGHIFVPTEVHRKATAALRPRA